MLQATVGKEIGETPIPGNFLQFCYKSNAFLDISNAFLDMYHRKFCLKTSEICSLLHVKYGKFPEKSGGASLFSLRKSGELGFLA